MIDKWAIWQILLLSSAPLQYGWAATDLRPEWWLQAVLPCLLHIKLLING